MKENATFWILVAGSFTLYFILTYLYKQLRIINLEGAIQKIRGVRLLNTRHLVGILVLGLLFYLAFPETRDFLDRAEGVNAVFILLLGAFIVISSSVAYQAFRSKKFDFGTKVYANPYQAWGYFVLRLLFLFSYEYFFRGILFLGLLSTFPLLTAILINTVLYVIIHLFDSRKEVFGAIPFGIVMCLFVYFANSIWPAFLLHAALSLTYEISLYKKTVFKTEPL